jgi:hypothetical protein
MHGAQRDALARITQSWESCGSATPLSARYTSCSTHAGWPWILTHHHVLMHKGFNERPEVKSNPSMDIAAMNRMVEWHPIG